MVTLCSGRFTPVKELGTHGMGGRKSLRVGLKSFGKETNRLPLLEFESRTVASGYTDLLTLLLKFM